MADVDPGPFATAPVPEVTVSAPGDLDRHLLESAGPFVVRGLVSDWPLVQAGRKSGREARAYLLSKSRAAQFVVSIGESGSGGPLFYTPDIRVDFRTLRAGPPDIF